MHEIAKTLCVCMRDREPDDPYDPKHLFEAAQYSVPTSTRYPNTEFDTPTP